MLFVNTALDLRNFFNANVCLLMNILSSFLIILHLNVSSRQTLKPIHELSLISLKKIHRANNWFENSEEQATHF